jgi:hypothetical protein
VPDLPPHPSLEYLRKQAKTRKRERGIGLSQAQHELAREYGFASWPQLARHVQASSLEGIERALVLPTPRRWQGSCTPIRQQRPLQWTGWHRCWWCCDGRSARRPTSAPA